jgi:hypothetical protein
MKQLAVDLVLNEQAPSSLKILWDPAAPTVALAAKA